MAHPDFIRYKDLYAINELSFKTKTDLINSNYIQTICPPFQSFLDKRNKRGAENYARYLNIGNFISNPQICLDSALGLVNKGEDELKVPANVSDIEYYATKEGTNITSIKNQLLASIFKYGSALLKVVIPENVSIANTLPRFEVIEGNKVVDYGTYLDEQGNQQFSFIVIDTTRPIFNPNTKYYNTVKIYKILSLNSEGNYYEAEIPQNLYSTFSFTNPTNNQDKMISYYEPQWNAPINFIPVIGLNKLDCTFKYTQAFIQDLIETSLHNYRLSCTLGWLELNSAASHLVIKGKNLDDIDSYPVGAGAVHVLNDESASEEYVTPSTNGMSEIKQHINENNALIDAMNYSLLNAAANSSGDALAFRISVKCADLISLINNIGNCITRGIENIDEIVNYGKNKDNIEFIPYKDFDKSENYMKVSTSVTELEQVETVEDQNN